MATPTLQEQDLCRILRSRTTDLHLEEDQLHDQHLLRWIRAREGNVSRAEEMLRRHIQWRKSNRIGPPLMNWIPTKFLTETYRPKFCGYDSTGSPILLFSFGTWDLRPALTRGEKENLIRYKDQSLEKIMRLMKLYENQRQLHPNLLSGSPATITQFICICDWSGFSLRYMMSKEVVDLLLDAVRSFEANYPETLKASYNVNCPKVFDVLFKLVKPFLSERTLSKISIHDSDQTRWKQDILGKLPSDQVPVEYGGTRESIWDLADLNVDPGQDGTFFRKIFRQEGHGHGNEVSRDELDEGFNSVAIASGEKVAIPITITAPRTRLKWTVRTRRQSDKIQFSVQLEDPASTERETCVERVNVSRDEGMMECERPGKYWAVIGNEHSAETDHADDLMVNYKLAMDIP